LQYVDPAAHPNRFVAEILTASPSDSGELVLPMTDLTTMILASDGRLGRRLLSPPYTAYDELSDKAKLVQRAASLGIEIPETYVVSNLDTAREAISRVGAPVVIKPARSRLLHKGRILATSVVISDTSTDALRVLQNAEWFGPIPALVQRYVSGTGAGVFALFHDGTPVAWFAHQRLREKPPGGGVSVLSESIEPDLQLLGIGERLLRSVGWSGVAMVEFKIAADGTAYLMEVNGRFWGSLQLSIDCGVDFPWLLYQQTVGIQSEAPPTYFAGRRLHWFLGDLDRMLIQLRDRDNKLSATVKLRYAAEFLGACVSPRNRSEVLRLSDPKPAISEMRKWVEEFCGHRH
jgi:predicted ATP-grasp superfamily ATP-dependent carboligase